MATGSTVITGGLVLASGASHAAPADLLLHDDLIVAITPPGEVTSESAQRIDAANRLIIPGLINAHTHSHGGLAKGAGDRWSLELLLNAGPWLNGGRTDDDRYLSALLAAVEMLRKGCTACYDLAAMLPLPTVEGLHSISQAYADAGIRAVIAPMIADRSFYQAIPGLLDAFPPELRAVADTMQTAPGEAALAAILYCCHVMAISRRPHPPGHCANHSAALFRRIPVRMSGPRGRIRSAASDAPGRVQRSARRCGTALWHHADAPPGSAWCARSTI